MISLSELDKVLKDSRVYDVVKGLHAHHACADLIQVTKAAVKWQAAELRHRVGLITVHTSVNSEQYTAATNAMIALHDEYVAACGDLRAALTLISD